MRKRNANAEPFVFWVKLRQSGSTRATTDLYRLLRRQGQIAVKPPNPKYIAKPYKNMQYPGPRVQIDVKFVPEACIAGKTTGKKFYQHTAIDEYAGVRCLETFEKHSTYSPAIFRKHLSEKFPFRTACIQTDNGCAFAKRPGSSNKPKTTRFERMLEPCGIQYNLIKPYPADITARWGIPTASITSMLIQRIVCSFEDVKQQPAVYSRQYNPFPVRSLVWKSTVSTLSCLTHSFSDFVTQH